MPSRTTLLNNVVLKSPLRTSPVSPLNCNRPHTRGIPNHKQEEPPFKYDGRVWSPGWVTPPPRCLGYTQRVARSAPSAASSADVRLRRACGERYTPIEAYPCQYVVGKCGLRLLGRCLPVPSASTETY